MGYLLEDPELLIRKVAYTKYDATGLVRWSNFTRVEIKKKVPVFPVLVLVFFLHVRYNI
jgi:hypothetical protein